ncbi:MAG: B12-binding domain-containing radical SAM protein [Cetobacterium sp.]|uniref:B12-binding domain-containing radical SAM protein n=1 Tax=Cetobacterium sp. TaxID=2071632 RepID=UPI003F3F1126
MKKIILINSPLDNMDGNMEKEDSIPPLGLGYIAYELEKNGFKTELLDGFNKALSKEQIVNKINLEMPYAVTINIFTSNMDLVKDIVQNIDSNIKIVIGGLVVKDIAEEIITWNVKGELSIVIGEGEYIVPQLLLDRDKVEYISKQENKRIYKVDIESDYFPKDLSSLKIKRELFENEPQKNKYGQEEAYIVSSRGCPYECSFCGAANSPYNKNIGIFKIRYSNKESILEEIKELKALHPEVQSIRILDDLFLSSIKNVDEAIQIFKETGLEWRAMAHSKTFSNFTDEKFKELKESGCKELFIGIESGCEDTLKRIKKERKNSDLLIHLEKLLKNGINIKGYFIYGFPNEEKENMDKTYEFAEKIKRIQSKYKKGKFETSVFGYRPYHGTELYQEAIEKNNLESKSLGLAHISKKESFNLNIKNYSNVSDEELESFIKKTK